MTCPLALDLDWGGYQMVLDNVGGGRGCGTTQVQLLGVWGGGEAKISIKSNIVIASCVFFFFPLK